MKQLLTVGNRCFAVMGLLLVLVFAPLLNARGAAGDVDLSFDPGSGVDGQVNVIVAQPDGKVIIGGEFLTVKGLLRPHLARLNIDGSGDATFDAGPVAPGGVNAIAVQPDGKVLFARDIHNLSSQPIGSDLRRLNSDGTLDSGFHSDTGAHVLGSGLTCMALQPDGKVLAGGYFNDSFVDDEGFVYFFRRSLLIRLNADGTADKSFNSVAGPYNIGEHYSTWIESIALQPDGKILIGGHIDTRVNEAGRYGIARHHADGNRDHSFQPGVDGYVNTVVLQPDGKVLIGGSDIGNDPARHGLARLNADGSVDAGFDPGAAGIHAVQSLALVPETGMLLVSGSFSEAEGQIRTRIVRLRGDGTLDDSFDPGTGPGAPDNGRVAVALVPDGKIFCGGSFTTFDGIGRERAVRLHADGSLDSTFNPGAGIDGSVGMISLQADGALLIGGSFTRAGGERRNRVARLHAGGVLDASFDPGPGISGGSYILEISAIAAQADGKVMIGGDFTSVSGISRYRLARLHANGSVDSGFVSGVGGGGFDPVPVQSIVMLADGRMLVAEPGGVDGINVPKAVVRLHPDGSLDSGFGENVLGDTGGTYAVVRSFALQPDGKIVIYGYYVIVGGGEFDFYDYLVTRLNPDGSVDAGFEAPRISGDPWHTSFFTAAAVALQPDGKVLIGGNFSTVHGAVRSGIARLHPDGSLDDSFNPGSGVNGEYSPAVTSIRVQPDGRILIAGTFTGFNGLNRNRIVRLNADGSVDSTFDPGTGADGAVRAIALQPDGNVIISGEFNTVNGVARPRIVRLCGDAQSPASFATWAAGFGLAGGATAASADSDHDGLQNGVEYILGGNPVEPSTFASRLPAVTLGGGDLIFTFSRDDASETSDVTLTIETGSDLVTWPAIFTIGPDTAASTPGVIITENGNAPDTITVAIPLEADKAKFARLKVTITG